MTTLREDLNIKPEDFYVLFKGDKDLYAQAANILYDWYEAEGAFEDFSSKEEFLDFVEQDIYNMLDAADLKEDVITVEKAMGIYDPEEWEESEELDEQGEDDEGYEPQLTTDPMNAGQWYESLHEEKDRYSVLREALDRLDREDNRGKKSKVRAQVRNLRSKLK